MKKWLKFLIFIIFLATLSVLVIYYLKNFHLLPVSPKKIISQVTEKEEGEESVGFPSFLDKLLGNEAPQKYLVLFLNSMELRPGGGFIGSFSVIELSKGDLKSQIIHDTGIFDGLIKDGPPAPYLIEKFLQAPRWGIRDSNWSLDFKKNSQKAIELYNLTQEPDEKIAGVIGVTTNILPFLIENTGETLKIEGIEGEFNKENCLEKLEYEVELGYIKRGVKKENRKDLLREVMDILIERVRKKNKLEQLMLLNNLKKLLKTKDVQLFFEEETMQNFAAANNWTGEIIKNKDTVDYLSVVDANLGARKTDRCLERSFNYTVDFSEEKPQAILSLEYKNTCQKKDFMTDNYHSYLRIYASSETWLLKTAGFDKGRIDELMQERDDAVIEKEGDKITYGNLAYVFLNSNRSFTFHYTLPPNLKEENYKLYFQKQAGMIPPTLKVNLKNKDGEKTIFEGKIDQDILIEK